LILRIKTSYFVLQFEHNFGKESLCICYFPWSIMFAKTHDETKQPMIFPLFCLREEN